MRFGDRADAGRQLAAKLAQYAGDPAAIVLGIPRGGAIVAFQIAQALHLPLDIFLSRKLGVPGHEELAFGAVSAGGGRYLDAAVIRAARVSPEEIERITAEARALLEGRSAAYRRGRGQPVLQARTAILVDDGIATGASMIAAVRALREMKTARAIIAVPVAPRSACEWLAREADELVVVTAPPEFYAVGQFYEEFHQVSDEEVIGLLNGAVAEPGDASQEARDSGMDA